MQLFEELGKRFDSFTIMKEEAFLARKANSFDNNIPFVVYNIKDSDSTFKKVKEFFGNPDIENNENYIIITTKSFLEREKFSYGDLVEIIKRLRDPDGCLWDRKQTNMSIRENAVEEAYELVEAIELDDTAKILEEAGDVLLQGLFNGVIAEEDGRFLTNDVISQLCKKLVFRHTHIFGKDKANNCEDALHFWEKAKAVEKGQKSLKDKLDAVPKSFGSTMRANKIQKIIKKTGFEFPDIEEAYKKIFEEVEELKEATGKNIEREGGDLLFSSINVLRMLGVDPELALNGTTNRFIQRFLNVEKQANAAGKKAGRKYT